jgi:3-oxoacyl-[acyl-carrier-protein] synthase III
MNLAGVACALPSERIYNDEILELVEYYSRGLYEGDIPTLIATIDTKLRRTGIESRYWRSSKDRPIAFLQRACEDALRESNVARNEVDFVIYVGVDRGFLEPANACFIAKELGMNRVRTFDVVDACLGWCTATEVAQALFASARGAVGLIVSAEFPMRLHGPVIPECFTFGSEGELEWKFPALTLGEAASASVLVAEGPSWRYVHESHNELADLCTVGFGPSTEYAGPSSRLSSSGESRFRAYGSDLARQIFRPAVRVLRELVDQIGGPRVIFPHSVIGPYIEGVVERVSPDLRVFSTFAEMGNLATSSLPTCIMRARQKGILRAGDVPIGWAAASGLKVSAFEIVQRLS